jgi:hypothetical protein
MNQAMGAFPGMLWLTAAIIAIICSLLTQRIPQVVIWALVALVLITFWPVVTNAVQTRGVSSVGTDATAVIDALKTNWVLPVIRYVAFLVVIAVLFLLRSAFRRG